VVFVSRESRACVYGFDDRAQVVRIARGICGIAFTGHEDAAQVAHLEAVCEAALEASHGVYEQLFYRYGLPVNNNE
jgi:hypothetical protein